jgi:hypothetical protein
MIRLPDQLDLPELGVAAPPYALLTDVARAALRDDGAEVVTATGSVVAYPFTSIATGGLWRVTGTATTATGVRPWRAFVKLLQHPRHWPLHHLVPPAAFEDLCRLFPWRDELDIRAQVHDVLPDGLRVPDVYALADLGEDRVAVWMEDIDERDDRWTDTTHATAARLLARLASRRTPDRPAGACSVPPGFAVRKVVDSRAPMLAGALADDALWRRPLVAAAFDGTYRTDLSRALDRIPALLAESEALPTALPHGDAAPVNLLRPRDEPDTFVAIDWAFGCQLPLGFDLGQLLCGEIEQGRGDADGLPGLLDAIETGYVAGLADEGLATDRGVVRRGLVLALATRNVPGMIPWEVTEGDGADPDTSAFLGRRAALGRFVLDLVLSR